MIELMGSERLVTMSIGHFTWCIVAALFLGSAVGMFALAVVHSVRHGDDK